MILAYNQSKKKDFVVDDKIFPQTLKVIETRAKPLGINIIKLDLDGAYIPSFNKKTNHLSYSYKKKFVLIGMLKSVQ